MPVIASFLDDIVREVPRKLRAEGVATAYLRATGNSFDDYLGSAPSLSVAFARALSELDTVSDGGRWLLAYALASPKADLELFRLVVDACPEVLGAVGALETKVDAFLRTLADLEPVLAGPFESRLRRTGPVRQAMGQVRALLVFKTLHEALHLLSLRLAYAAGEAAVLFGEGPGGVAALCAEADAAAGTLGEPARTAQKAWIAALRALGEAVRAALDAGLSAAPALEDIGRFVALRLFDLNRQIQDVATALALDALLDWMPPVATLITAAPEREKWAAFEPRRDAFEQAVRDLGPTILADALVHRIWQVADSEIAIMAALAETAPADLGAHWWEQRDVIVWFAGRETSAEWAAQLLASSSLVTEEVTREDAAERLKPLLADYRKAVSYRFLAVDAALKADCRQLARIDPPLAALMQGLPGHG